MRCGESSGDDLVAHLTATWESIGVLVFHHEITLEVLDDFFSRPIVPSWNKLRPIWKRNGSSSTTAILGRNRSNGWPSG